MNPSVAIKGRSFKGIVAYITHDPGKAKSDERVLFTETRNLRTNDPEKAAKVMAYTAMHASELKAASGHKATGRKTDSPVYHAALSWIPGEKPTQAEMMEAGVSAMKALGFEEHEAVFSGHGDKEHLHLHIALNRVHPVTGLTHNPKDDHNTLQAWAHEYDKARGQAHRSPVRAAKYEKDPALKAAYQEQAKAVQEKKGAEKSSKVRPEWKAEKGATHPKSLRFQAIKAEYAGQVKALSAESRDLTARHKSEWQELKDRQAEERAALSKRQAGAPSMQFNRAATGDTRQQFGSLKASHRAALREREAAARRENAPAVSAFLAQQRDERRAFMRQEKASARNAARNLRLAASTPVGRQGPEHRRHLAGRFNRAIDPEAREVAFAKRQQKEKAAFFDSLAERERPQIERLQAVHAEQTRALRERLQAAKAAAKPSVRQRQGRAALTATQREERTALRTRQDGEQVELQAKWAALNENRAQAWEAYRQHRAKQEAAKPSERARDRGEGLKDIYQERASHFENRRVIGSDYVEQIKNQNENRQNTSHKHTKKQQQPAQDIASDMSLKK